MTLDFNSRNRIKHLDTFIRDYLEEKDIENSYLKDAMKYSLFTGGKRIRPLLFFTLLEDLEIESSSALFFAAALECIHTYSLIHDDLPPMDNDDIRRGKPTNHRVYGEAMAILAGDGLLNEAMELVLTGISQLPSEEKNRGLLAAKYLFKASGVTGMIDGQAMDIYEGAASENLKLYEKKTGALIGASLAMASALYNGNEELSDKFYSIGLTLGISYQLQDDRFDIIEDGVLVQEGHLNKLKEEATYYTNKVFIDLDSLLLNVDNLKHLIQEILDRKE